MKTQKKILLVTTEDVGNLKSWSNVPYLFFRSLKDNVTDVHPYLIKEISLLKYVINKTVYLFNKFSSNKCFWDYSRSSVHQLYVRYQVYKVCKKISPDFIIALTFSYRFNFRDTPVYLVGDWTFQYLLDVHKNKDPNFLEKKVISYENDNILAACASITLFPYSCQYINKSLKINTTQYFGNVINAVCKPSVTTIQGKNRNRKILFIGRGNYYEGLLRLIESFSAIRKIDSSITLDIIGMDKIPIDNLPEGIFFHGYLNKSIKQECDLYYCLVENATLIVNPNPKWSSFSSILEAMYFYTPVICSKTEEMIYTFSNEISFGHYCCSNEPLESQILDIIFNENYTRLALNAHDAVSGFTWNKFTDRLLCFIEQDLKS